MRSPALLISLVWLGCGPTTPVLDAGIADAASTDAASDAGAPGACPQPSGDGMVATRYGAVAGTTRDGVTELLGIPYAAPPVGARRFRAPEPPACIEGVLSATAFGSSCVQHQPGPLVGSEDCLTLNVWAPVDAEDAPVLFFLPAGDNLIGGSGDTLDGVPIYDGERLARTTGMIVVTANYRLGALGFLSDPALDDDGVHANFGLLDQIAALSWVKDNIVAFGGDPARVLLSGLSAGASDACALIASPRAADLFSSAHLFSGSCDAVIDADAASEISRSVRERLGCDDAADVAACLRAADVEDIAALPSDTAEMDWNPTIDGVVLADLPTAVIAAGDHRAVPMVISSTAHEYALLIDAVWSGPLETEADYVAAVDAIIGNPTGGALVREQYPLEDYGRPRDALTAIFTDAIFDCPARTLARAATTGQAEPIWRTYYAHRFASPAYGARGAAHGFDVLLAFQALDAVAPTDDESALAIDLGRSMAALARSGAPGPIRGVELAPYDRARDPRTTVELEPRVLENLRDAACDFWDANL